MKEIGLEIQRRAVLPMGADPGSEAEYQGLMNELYQTYGATRSRLLRPVISKKMAEIAASPSSSKDLVSFAQSGLGFLRGICEDEYNLWKEWFANDDALYEFLEELVEPFYHMVLVIMLVLKCMMYSRRSSSKMAARESEHMVCHLSSAVLVMPALQ